ncbi:hypothetical protein [Streptomyces sp. NPDC001165]|uniref:hypothetical protein n=1 Tax=Streptomyces sp. NPDC001165 TaxID=3364546 RepID=UPI0036B87ADE
MYVSNVAWILTVSPGISMTVELQDLHGTAGAGAEEGTGEVAAVREHLGLEAGLLSRRAVRIVMTERSVPSNAEYGVMTGGTGMASLNFSMAKAPAASVTGSPVFSDRLSSGVRAAPVNAPVPAVTRAALSTVRRVGMTYSLHPERRWWEERAPAGVAEGALSVVGRRSAWPFLAVVEPGRWGRRRLVPRRRPGLVS